MSKTTEGKKARPAARARLMAAIAVCAASALALEPPAAFAATDPIAAVDNLSTFIFGLIRSVGLILLGFGVGGQLVLASAVKSGDFAAIQARAKQFTDAIAAWNEKHS